MKVFDQIKKAMDTFNLRKSMVDEDTAIQNTMLINAANLPILGFNALREGLIELSTQVLIKEVPIEIPFLPENLNGMKILQISDLHLSFSKGLNDLEELIEKVKEKQVDLVLITGDFCDDFSLIKDAIKIVETLNPPGGIYAAMGNHEYYGDTRIVKHDFESSSIPMLIDQTHRINHQGSNILIAGIDDPIIMQGNIQPFLTQSIRKINRDRNQDDFTILMAHRPPAFVPASESNIPLTLSGHTHGSQIGFNGRSIFQYLSKETYLWGEYERGNSKLYTTSGCGQWFPFRLGCPAELPIITLQKP